MTCALVTFFHSCGCDRSIPCSCANSLKNIWRFVASVQYPLGFLVVEELADGRITACADRVSEEAFLESERGVTCLGPS